MDLRRTPPTSSQVRLAEVGTCDACLRSGRQRVNVGLALGSPCPAPTWGLPCSRACPPTADAAACGLGVRSGGGGAAFVLSWSAELAALEISAGLAISVLALVAVPPEYAVDFV